MTTALPAILFVCLGNICRSPLAEAALRTEAARHNLNMEIDSAGTGGWHAGDPPDPRAQATARRHSVDISRYQARQVRPDDFHRFDHIFALDPQNLADLMRVAPSNATARTSLLMDLVPGREGTAVIDPYYGDEADFETTWADVTRAARAIMERLAG
ncbi:low molecular weight protein-tyrosine-phosphatase [Sphingobium sp. CR28]|uniref:low molecular weight protein-tyrosine-phosphatase n=1 Tax=Sphingobium sp. CR28 TaxID=3400272 RepID=UPI003FF09976